MSQPAPCFAGLSLTEKRMLLAELLRDKATRHRSVYPLSHGQRGLWFLYQLNPDNAAYNMFFPARIRSRVDVPAFRQALQRLVDRHPALRTTFDQRDGELAQRVRQQVSASLEVLDVSGWDEETLCAHVEEEAYRPFDLARAPLVRAYLFSVGPQDHVFLLTAHHIIGDFWSLVLVMEDMQTLYAAECRGVPAALAIPTSHYGDFVRWQTDLLAGPEGDQLWAYWRQQLAGAPTVLELPSDRPRPPRFTQRGAAVSCHIEAGRKRRLKALAAAEGVTLYTVLLSAFQVLLARHSGQNDFLVGSPFAGRSRPDFERVVGYFINMLPLRARMSGELRFRDLVRRTGATVLEALAHQDYPFPLLVERLNFPRDGSRPPLVQASFTLEKAHRPVGMGSWSFCLPEADVRLNVAGLASEPYRVEQRACQMDVEMVLEESGSGIYGMLRYNAAVFDEDTMQRMAAHYGILLEGAAADPERRVAELPLLTSAEERQVLCEWNDTVAPAQQQPRLPGDQCLHQMFECQARQTPEAPAVRFKGRSVSYAELDARANRIAHRLHRRGIGSNTPVALCLERSPDMVAAILAVLKSGGAYVPLDPAIPAERLRTILTATRAPLLLTQPSLVDRLSGFDVEVISMDGTGPGEELGPSPTSGGPNDLAYIIYTSGSTGRPRGVLIEHRAVCNTIRWYCQSQTVRQEDRVLLLVPYVFDPSISFLFSALAVGAEVILGEEGEERDPARVLERLARDQVTILPLTPRTLRLILDERLRAAGRTLRRICCGGESMPPDLPARLFELLDVELYNCYGPTEAAIDATFWRCRRGDDRPSVPIGRPIANVRVYVLDAHRRPVPVGVPGELYIGGAGLARGYLNEPELTAERFVPDPFGAAPGGRLYRTGDRCRWLADGGLEFLGRLDDQVKIRGCRVEIGEIEAVLSTHPLVQETAVLVSAGAAGGERLVAYVSSRASGGPPTVEMLRRHLRDRLPEYMVPAAFVLLPSLPHTASGKIDRRLLPAPPAERSLTSPPFVEPRTPLEQFLADRWRELLGVRQIGVHDNFFELGGNSLQAALLLNHLQQKLGRPVYIVALFEAPSIASLVRYLAECYSDVIPGLFGEESLPATAPIGLEDSAHRAGPKPCSLLVCLQDNGTEAPCFLVHPPGGIVVCYQPLAHHLGRERPVYGIRARGLHGETDLPRRLEDMAAEYVAAIRSVQPEGPYHLGGWSAGGVIAYEMAQQLRAQGRTVGLLALLDTTIPVNASNSAYAEEAALSAREYGLNVTLAELERMGPEEQLPYLWEHVRKLGLIEEDMPLPLIRQILDELKRFFHAHIRLVNDYVVRPYTGRLTLFRPADSPLASVTPPDRNWGQLAAAVEVQFVPGLHHTMVKEPHVRILADQLRTKFRVTICEC